MVTSDGQRLSFMNATGRYFAKILSAIILMAMVLATLALLIPKLPRPTRR